MLVCCGSNPSQANDGRPSSGLPPSFSSFTAHSINFFIGGEVNCHADTVPQRDDRSPPVLKSARDVPSSPGLSCLCTFSTFILLPPLAFFHTPENPALNVLSSLLCI